MIITIRRAKNKDVNLIYRFCRHGFFEGELLSRTRHDIEDNIRSFFIAENKRGAMGCCALEIYSEKSSEIRSLYIVDRYRQRGIAKILVDAAISYAKKRRIREVFIVSKNKNLLTRLGFATEYEGKYVSFKLL